MNDGLLEGGDYTGMDGGVHESILDGVEMSGEDVIVSCNAHVMCNGRWCLVCMSGR